MNDDEVRELKYCVFEFVSIPNNESQPCGLLILCTNVQSQLINQFCQETMLIYAQHMTLHRFINFHDLTILNERYHRKIIIAERYKEIIFKSNRRMLIAH